MLRGVAHAGASTVADAGPRIGSGGGIVVDWRGSNDGIGGMVTAGGIEAAAIRGAIGSCGGVESVGGVGGAKNSSGGVVKLSGCGIFVGGEGSGEITCSDSARASHSICADRASSAGRSRQPGRGNPP